MLGMGSSSTANIQWNTKETQWNFWYELLTPLESELAVVDFAIHRVLLLSETKADYTLVEKDESEKKDSDPEKIRVEKTNSEKQKVERDENDALKVDDDESDTENVEKHGNDIENIEKNNSDAEKIEKDDSDTDGVEKEDIAKEKVEKVESDTEKVETDEGDTQKADAHLSWKGAWSYFNFVKTCKFGSGPLLFPFSTAVKLSQIWANSDTHSNSHTLLTVKSENAQPVNTLLAVLGMFTQ